ncbi:MAG: hypothetical protein WKG32_18040 [Gemmatimonadaceae bacterium]
MTRPTTYPARSHHLPPRISRQAVTGTRHLATATLALVLAGAIVPHDMAAQQAARQPVRSVPITTTDATTDVTTRANAEADALEARATALVDGQRKDWATAAALQGRAAALRADHPRAVASWSRAAWLHVGAKDRATARRLMERAARQALAGGDVERAANAYLDAALIARDDGREEQALRLARSARALAGSPLLSVEQRTAILQRVGDTPRSVAASVRP